MCTFRSKNFSPSWSPCMRVLLDVLHLLANVPMPAVRLWLESVCYTSVPLAWILALWWSHVTSCPCKGFLSQSLERSFIFRVQVEINLSFAQCSISSTVKQELVFHSPFFACNRILTLVLHKANITLTMCGMWLVSGQYNTLTMHITSMLCPKEKVYALQLPFLHLSNWNMIMKTYTGMVIILTYSWKMRENFNLWTHRIITSTIPSFSSKVKVCLV